MPTIKITDAGVEPITLAEAKLHLKVDDAADDARITTLITAARTECEQLVQRTLITTTWELVLDRFPCGGAALQLLYPPALAVTSLKYLDVDGVEQTLAPADYLLDTAGQPAWVVPAYGKTWPATREQINAVRCRYTAGYGATAAAVPQPLKWWILLRIEQLHSGGGAELDEKMRTHSLLDGYGVYA